MSFDVGFQRALIRLCMVDESFNHKVMEYIDESFFTTEALGWCFKVMRQYYVDYASRCTDIPLRGAVRYASSEKVAIYGPEVEKIISLGFPVEADYIKATLREFIRRNKFAQAHRRSMELYNDGKYVECYDIMQEAMDQIKLIDFDVPDREWFFEGVQARQKKRYKKTLSPMDDNFPTGVEPLDDLIEGGVSLGEMFFVLSYPKIGKTTWLINMAFMATRVARAPVLYINLEGGTDLIANRLDSCFSREMYTSVKWGQIQPHIYRELIAEYQMLRKLLVIRTLNDWDTSILSIDAELRDLRAQGFVPSLIIIDYIDLLRARKRLQNETQEQIESTKDTKRLANRGYAVWSACQAQRPKLKKLEETPHLLRSSDIADAYGKIRIADGYGSLNQTRKEKAAGVMRLYWEGYRDAPVGRLIKLHNEADRMRFATKSEFVTMDEGSEDDDTNPEDFAD